MAIVKVESRFLKSARSHRGAIGLMQLMPVTAMEMAGRVGRNVSLDDVEEPDVNIHLGLHYLSLLRTEFGGDTVAMLAAYNAGPANVRAWIREDGALGPEGENIPYGETRLFVKRVLSTHVWLKRFQRVKNVFNA
jgi:soluble lytic murein transglycosylase